MFQFPWSASSSPMYSVMSDWVLLQPGFPIRTPPDQSLLTAPRGSFVVRHVLLRLLAPRHPPCALSSLTNMLRFCAARSVVRYFPFAYATKVHFQRIGHPKTYAFVFTTFIETCFDTSSAKRNVLIRKFFRFVIQFSRIK